MISKEKKNQIFPEVQFCINGYSIPYCLDRNSTDGGILLYVGENKYCLYKDTNYSRQNQNQRKNLLSPSKNILYYKVDKIKS